MRTNRKMLVAQANQMDEFYTVYKTIENELSNYVDYFQGKRVYCNCDNPKTSNLEVFCRKLQNAWIIIFGV